MSSDDAAPSVVGHGLVSRIVGGTGLLRVGRLILLVVLAWTGGFPITLSAQTYPAAYPGNGAFPSGAGTGGSEPFIPAEPDLAPVLPAPGLDADLADLRRRLELLEEEKTQRLADLTKPASPTATALNGKEKPKIPQDKWDVKLGGHVQLDYITWADAAPSIPDTKNYFEFRRLRLVADGVGYGVYDFRLQMTLEPETVGESPPGTIMSPDVKDAYFSINEVPWLGRVRIGNFFVPFSLEQVTNDTNNVFLERSIPTQGVFAVDREVGIAVYGATEDHRVTWTGGFFIDSISEGLKERIDDNQGYRMSGRITGLPYYDEASKGRYLVHLGAGILHTQDQDGWVRFRSRPQIHEGPRLIDSGQLSASSYTNANLEGAVVWGPVTVQSEVFLSHINLKQASPEVIHGGYVHVSWFVTGENRIFEPFGQHGAQFSRSVPRARVYGSSEGWSLGGWELKARYSQLNLDNVGAGVYHDVTAGLNWYWSDRVRAMFDWIHPITTQDAIYGSTRSDILGMRFDFNW